MTIEEARKVRDQLTQGWQDVRIGHDLDIIDETTGEDFGYYVRAREIGGGRTAIFDSPTQELARWAGSPA